MVIDYSHFGIQYSTLWSWRYPVMNTRFSRSAQGRRLTLAILDATEAVREDATAKVSLELVKHEGGEFAASRFLLSDQPSLVALLPYAPALVSSPML
jgi:hypothetical protein